MATERLAYGNGLLIEIRAERARAGRRRRRLLVGQVFAVLGRREAARRLAGQRRVLADGLERLRLAEAEVRAWPPSPAGSCAPSPR